MLATEPSWLGQEPLPNPVHAGIELLLDWQEAYEPDRPVSKLEADDLERYAEREWDRLAKLVAATPLERRCEWPYEGVDRVGPDGRTPAGNRVGGTSIVCLAPLGRSAGLGAGGNDRLEQVMSGPIRCGAHPRRVAPKSCAGPSWDNAPSSGGDRAVRGGV